MNITGKITGIRYKIFLNENLQTVDIKGFNINECPASCLVKDGDNTFALSKWVSPKRTRSYPYERVYNTLNFSKKITVIPIVKDEGADGDRDFLQWDTVSLMSLLDVFVIFAYYDKAVKNDRYENKITDFQFDNKYVISKIKEIENYHSSALHWNLNELNENFTPLFAKAKNCYAEISKQTGVKMHDLKKIDTFQIRLMTSLTGFMLFSRMKAELAQSREIATTQPKDNLSTFTKAKITITNYLGGQYFFTVDEVKIENDTISLIESKHSANSVLPSKGDIKDGLLKMILYSNLVDVEVDGVPMKSKAVLNLTSAKMKGNLTSEIPVWDRAAFLLDNAILQEQIRFIDTLLDEAVENKFCIKICKLR
ncbi:MAG: hypothetical protein LBS69_04680 [Prevotellaceae bacterium]|jgi:hypothetical protein|nr:hypothetical protein [Prevotellaceae bacterium]